MVFCRNTSHVDQSIVRSRLVRKKELKDFSIIHVPDIGEGCCIHTWRKLSPMTLEVGLEKDLEGLGNVTC